MFQPQSMDHLNLPDIWDWQLVQTGSRYLKLQPAKCHFAVKEVKFLGHIISRQGVRVDSDKTAGEFPTPRTQKQVRSLANYYRSFVQDFAKIATPLNALLSKDKGFE